MKQLIFQICLIITVVLKIDSFILNSTSYSQSLFSQFIQISCVLNDIENTNQSKIIKKGEKNEKGKER